MKFNEWWESDEPKSVGGNPYRKKPGAYWAWEGWHAAKAAQAKAIQEMLEEAYAAGVVAGKLEQAQPARPVKVCKGIPRVGCNYLAECETVCNKCGEVHSFRAMPDKAPEPCTLGVGCDEAGACYAHAVGYPERCPRER
jgi:hypothetical protein